jgi:hypothetical protein
VSLSQQFCDATGTLGGGPNNKRRESLRGVWACLPAAYEVSCRIRAGSPTGLWPDSPRTVASRRFGSPAPRRRGLGWQAATSLAAGGVYARCMPCQLVECRTQNAERRTKKAPSVSQFFILRSAFERSDVEARWWCPGTELNRRHADFQSAALPTELPGQN